MSATDPQTTVPGRRSRLRPILGGLLAIGAVWFVVTKRADAVLAWQAILAASPLWLVVSVFLGIGFMVNQALFHRSAQRALGVHFPIREVWRSSNASYFVNTIARTGGLAGVIAFTPAAERHGESRPRTVAAFLVVTIFSQLSFAVSLMAAVVVLVRSGSLTRVDLVGSIVFGLYTLALGVAVIAAIRSRQTLRRLYALPAKTKRRLLGIVRRSAIGNPDTSNPDTSIIDTGTMNTAAADDFYDAAQLFRASPRLLIGPVFHALMVELLGVALLWAVLHAVGGSIGVTGALVAYSVSVMFLIISILPGGLGFVEASLGVVLTGFGLATATAAAAVIIYRVLQLWLPFTVGAFAVRKATAPVEALRST